MNSDALIRRLTLAVVPASLVDTASDWERLERAARPFLDQIPLQPTLAALHELGPSLRRGDWQIAVTLVYAGDTWLAVSVKPAFEITPLLGLAIDLGTTTIAGELVDVESSTVLASRMVYNGQRLYGVDVTSRMMHAELLDGLEELRHSVLETTNGLIATLCDEAHVKTGDVKALVVAGNTIMQHLLLGLDTSSIRREPYVPATTSFPILNAGVVGLMIHDGAPLYLMPGASGYVGGDVTAGLLATHIPENESISILIDIGTNGETVLGNREFLLACSGSAGSAFEGCGLEWGMPAQPGAIEHVWIENGSRQIFYRTVSNEPPRGICGSGLIEALGAFLGAGAINRSGKVNLAGPNVRRRDAHPEVVLAYAQETLIGQDIALRQGDIENLIRDKAALYAGSRILLSNAGLTFVDIAEILIAGNFGQSLDIEQAVRIGLLPDLSRQCIHFIGNGSLAGARTALLSCAAWQHAKDIAASITCLELTTEPRYFEEYTAALFLPHTDLSLFPSYNL